ncbi:Serine/threonine-protein phosphatase T [Symbiodinium microadriaticum]|uniref:Serine/threonine-protein phosphatase T n=1 Tax=Symbiodinium microadriaticum TaxID=2951 RepID=A0A1Q9CF34_SYMMI|nr:Serine/threonine-protein phosphatase T [Symbiodinium microadriaticum]
MSALHRCRALGSFLAPSLEDEGSALVAKTFSPCWPYDVTTNHNMIMELTYATECLSKYNHRVLAAFQRMFKLLPLFGVVEQEIFVVHGGLFRSPGVTLESLRTLPEADWQRNYPNPLKKDDMDQGKVWTRNEEILFDALWADPHKGFGSKRSERGRVAVLSEDPNICGVLFAALVQNCCSDAV